MYAPATFENPSETSLFTCNFTCDDNDQREKITPRYTNLVLQQNS